MSNRIVWFLVFCGLVASASAQDIKASFDKYNFNVGGGPGIGRGTVANLVGDTYQVAAGGGVNFTRMFGADAEYLYYNLTLRPTVANEPGLAGGTGHFQSISVNGIVNVPRHIGKWGAYGIFGVGFDVRSVSLPHSQLLTSGTVCQPAYYLWWGISCFSNNPQVPPTVNGPQTLSSNTAVGGSANYGAGVTYQLQSLHHAKVFVEYRYHKAYQSDSATIVWPIRVGFRW